MNLLLYDIYQYLATAITKHSYLLDTTLIQEIKILSMLIIDRTKI